MRTLFIIIISLFFTLSTFAEEPLYKDLKQYKEWEETLKKYETDEKIYRSERQKEILQDMRITLNSDKTIVRICYEIKDLLYDYKLTLENINDPDNTYFNLEKITKNICNLAEREEKTKLRKR